MSLSKKHLIPLVMVDNMLIITFVAKTSMQYTGFFSAVKIDNIIEFFCLIFAQNIVHNLEQACRGGSKE